jgi:hypothetical protein
MSLSEAYQALTDEQTLAVNYVAEREGRRNPILTETFKHTYAMPDNLPEAVAAYEARRTSARSR